MLLSINIKNLLLIDSINAEFKNGLTIITGETGSGKSVILESLLLALGMKNNNVKPLNDRKGYAIAEFSIGKMVSIAEILEEHGIEVEGNLILKRVVDPKGKSQAYINDVPVSLNLLKQITENLIEVYGQHDFSSLFKKQVAVDILDEYAKNQKLLKELSEIYFEIKKLEKVKENLIAEYEKNIADKEYFESALSELKALDYQENEDQELSEKVRLFKNSEKFLNRINSSISSFEEEGFAVKLLSIIKNLGRVEGDVNDDILNSINEAGDKLDKAIELINDAETILLDIINSSNFSADEKQEIEDRLYRIKEICRKYNIQAFEIISFSQELESKVSLLNNNDKEIRNIDKELQDKLENYNIAADKLSKARKKAAEKIEKVVNSEFPKLKMNGAKFKIDFVKREEINEKGYDKCEFLIATNPNQPFENLIKVASGGEISRVMLALKIAFSEGLESSSLIFDEIDTGISGITAEAVGKRLQVLSKNMQVIVVTHQPQVASKADNHFLVSKKTGKKSSEISLIKLAKDQANKEVARLISGEDISDEALKVAKKLKA